MPPLRGSLAHATFSFDGGRGVSVYVPVPPAESVVFTVDGGWHLERLVRALEGSTERTSTMDEVWSWVASELSVDLTAERTAVWGASLGGEFALAMGLRHPARYGVVLCASPGGGFTPTDRALPSGAPRTYLVAGTEEQWFLDNANRWADAFREVGADVEIAQRNGEHGGAFWYEEFPHMVSWAFGR